MVLTSYEITFLLTIETLCKIIKNVLNIFAKNANNSKISTYIIVISLSLNTTLKRNDKISSDFLKQIASNTTNFKYFSYALHESCDITENTQLRIFIQSVNSKFEVMEELLGLKVHQQKVQI